MKVFQLRFKRTRVAVTMVACCFFATRSLAAPAMKPGQISSQEAERLAVSMYPPEYPLAARRKSITGSGVVLVKVNKRGFVTSATMAQSTGSPILDNAALSAFKSWRFKAGRAFWFRSPITFAKKPWRH